MGGIRLLIESYRVRRRGGDGWTVGLLDWLLAKEICDRIDGWVACVSMMLKGGLTFTAFLDTTSEGEGAVTALLAN